jgi:hypothetical protein
MLLYKDIWWRGYNRLNVECLEIDEKVLSKTTKNQNKYMVRMEFKMFVLQAIVKNVLNPFTVSSFVVPRGTRIKLHSARSKHNNFGNSADAPMCNGRAVEMTIPVACSVTCGTLKFLGLEKLLVLKLRVTRLGIEYWLYEIKQAN